MNSSDQTKSMKPEFSIVVPAYNEEKYIGACLESLLNQDIDRNLFEIIVVDNKSTDKTSQIASKMGAQIVMETKKGSTNARQAGFNIAKGNIIATTDADSIVPQNWLNFLAKEFESNPKLVGVSGMYDFYDGSPLLKLLTHLFNYPIFVIFNWYSGANLAVRKDAFKKVGGFKTNIPISEDSDLCRRLKKIGQVKRLANFKVKTSARRFRKGIIFGVVDYTSTHLVNRIGNRNKLLEAGSQT